MARCANKVADLSGEKWVAQINPELVGPNLDWIRNDYLLPLLVLGTGNQIQMLPIAIAGFMGSFVKQWELIMLTLGLAAIPVVVFYLIAQGHIVKGMIEGSLKG